MFIKAKLTWAKIKLRYQSNKMEITKIVNTSNYIYKAKQANF